MVDREEIDLRGNSLMCTFIFMMERGCISELTRPYTTTYAAGPLADREVEVYNGPDNVYDFIQNDVIGHMLVVIGYGAELIRGERVEFWIVQNSHGVAWGENGYGRFNVNITLPTGEPFMTRAWTNCT
ncbi:cathepsin L [Trifolium repens]|nr:cathepsin L [Trifolium repens]